jgi:hypothetical protein
MREQSAFPKRGHHPVGVRRQHCGALGKVANASVSVADCGHGVGAPAHRPDAASGAGLGAPRASGFIEPTPQTLPPNSIGLSPSETQELARLRREVAVLKMERDITKKAAAFFAKESR